MKLIITSPETRSEAIGIINQLYKLKPYLEVKISQDKTRSLPQNAIQHVWYSQVSRELKEHTAEEVKCLAKYHFGLPIVRGDDEEFNAMCVKVIDPLPYEDMISAMKYLPVTSLMKTKQKSEYLEAVQKNYIGRVELEFPDVD